MKSLTLILTFCLYSIALCAQGLSEQNLLDLKKAGIDKAIVIQQIEKDGINFQMDASTTIRLKNIGFSDDVLSALLNASKGTSHSVSDDPVKSLYSQGKYTELCDYLKSQVDKDPANYRLRTILIGSLLKINQQPAALAELEKLKDQSRDPAAKAYLASASLLVSSWQKQQEAKNKLLTALQNYNYAEAGSAIDQLPASAMQRQILHMLIDSYAGKFDEAIARTSQLQSISFTDKERIDAIKDKIAFSEKSYHPLMDRVNLYYYSPKTLGDCTDKQFSISEYIDIVGKLSKLAPLNPQVMNLAFHATLLSSQYENLQTLGDKILAAQGTIRIPFYSRDRYFDVVIDSKMKSIYSQPDSHHFAVSCEIPNAMNMLDWSVHRNADHDGRLSKLVSFNLPFDQVRSISQKAGSIKNSYALSFEPAGVAPNYALMQMLDANVGEEAELQATKNLGLFVLHVIGNTNVKAELADPSKAAHHGGDSGFGDAIVAMYGATHGNTPVGAMAIQLVEESKAQNAMAAQQQEATWQTMLARDYSSLLDGSVFDGLDKLVEIQ
jgi:hypothetical protein